MEISILPLQSSQLDDVFEIYKQCEDFLALGPVPYASMNMVRTDFEHSQKSGGIFCGIFDQSNKMIGVVDYIPRNFENNPQEAFLELLMIAAPYRGNGIGEKVVQVIEQEIQKDPQIYTICSGVQVNNPKAVQFWKKQGYQISSEPRYMPDQTIAYELKKILWNKREK